MAFGNPGHFISKTAPTSPVEGHTTWLDANSSPGTFNGWTGSAWTPLASQGVAAGSGISTIVFRPYMNEPPSSNYATLDTRNGRPVLVFTGSAADQEAVFSGVLFSDYSSGGLTVSNWWTFTTATSGSLRIQAAFERLQEGALDIDADSFAPFVSAGGTAPATNGQAIKVDVTFANSEISGLLAGEIFRLKIRRDADGTSGTDDITTNAELLMARIVKT